MNAQLRPSYDGGLAQFRVSWATEVGLGDISVVTDVDAGNIDPALVTIDNTNPTSPIIWLDARAGATGGSNGSGWRHFLCAVENAEGKTPVFRMNRATMTSASVTPAADYLPNWTADFVSYTLAPSRALVGGSSGYIEWQFTDPLPSGRVYVMSQPTGRQSDADALAGDLLTNYSSVVTPTASANISGVFATSPAETDDLGRAVGSNPMYAVKFAWGGPTTDGGPKRKLVMFAGLHSAGENTSFIPFRRFVYWALNDLSQAAQNLRANWDIYAYFNLTPNGIKGGHRRHNFRISTDPNRDFKLSGASSLSEITAVRTASVADVGACDAFFSWHGHSTQTTAFIPGKNDQNAPVVSTPVAQFIAAGELIFGSYYNYDSDTIASSDAWWGEAVLGAKVALHAEIPQRGTSSLSYYETIGENWAKTLEATDAQGVFYTASSGQLVIAPSTQGHTSQSVAVQVTGSQYARPTSDVSAGSWAASTGGSLASTLDETTPSDTDYITASGSTPCTISLGAIATPGAGTTKAVKFRAWSPTSGSVNVDLLQNTTVIATWAQTLTASATTYTKTLTSLEAANISDYSALRIRLTAS